MAWRDLFRTKARPLTETYREQRVDVVSTYDVNQYYTSVLDGKRWNPDDLVGKKGLPIYSTMLNDEQVKSVTEFKLNAILGRGYQFKFKRTKLSDTEQKQRIAVFEEVLCKMRGSFVDALEGIASGREYGFSVTEKVYGDIQVDGKTFKGVNMLLTRDPCSFDFYADDYGLLKKIEQLASGKPNVVVDRDKVIHYVHKPKWDMIFGRSELRSAYRAWYAKDQLVKLWLLHLERFGSGVWVASQDGESGLRFGSPEHTALQNALINAKGLSSIITPKGVTVEIQFPATTDQYEKALQYFDLAIAKSQLVPNLLGLSHTGQTGAYSQSQTQFEAFFWTTSADGSRLAECLNEELFRDLGDQNWDDGDYPMFCFKPMTMDAAIKLLTEWREQVAAGGAISTEDDERFIRALLDMPERDEDAEPLVDPMADRQQTHTEEQANIANDQKQQELDQAKKAARQQYKQLEDQIAEIRTKLTSINVTVHNPAPSQASPSDNLHVRKTGPEGAAVAMGRGDMFMPGDRVKILNPHEEGHETGVVSYAEGSAYAVVVDGMEEMGPHRWYAPSELDLIERTNVVPHGKLRSATLAQFTRAAQRVAFSVIEKRTDDFAVSSVGELAGIVAKATKRALGDDTNMAQLIDEDQSDVAAIDLNGADRGKLKSACRDLLMQSWTLGSNLASNEIQRAQGERWDMSVRRERFANLRDNAAAYFDTQSFRMAGDTSDQVRKIIQQELQNGIKFGKSIPETRIAIWERLVSKGLTTLAAVKGSEPSDAIVSALNDLMLGGIEDVPAYLNTLVRTNTFEALNEARYAEFTDPAVSEFVEALEYAAVLDSSTTEICRELNGKVYRADSPEWDSIRPPNHFNCRSVLVPVTTIDGWDGQESEKSTVEPAEGFK